MRIQSKSFSYLLIFGFCLISVSAIVSYKLQESSETKAFLDKYNSLSNYIESSFIQLEKKSSLLLLSTAKHTLLQDNSQNALSTHKLKKIAHNIGIDHIFIINKMGKFIRSTNENPSLIPNLFSFSDKYRKLLTTTSYDYLETPIISPTPEYFPYKFLVIPNREKSRLIEVGVRVDFIGNVLTQIINNDNGIKKIELFSPQGLLIGRFGKKKETYKREKVETKHLSPGVEDFENYFVFTRKIPFYSKKCAQCSLSNNEKYHYYLKTTVDNNQLKKALTDGKRKHFTVFLWSICLAALFSFFISRQLVKKLIKLSRDIDVLLQSQQRNLLTKVAGNDEVSNLEKNFNKLLTSLYDHQEKLIKLERDSITAKLSKQVAHDIRSPLSALNMLLKDVRNIPEERRILMRNSVNRINDIANELIEKNKIYDKKNIRPTTPSSSKYLVSALIESIISEKRTQYRNLPNVNIEAELGSESYGLFVEIDQVEFKRAVSNIVNNSVEAISNKESGKIKISISSVNSKLVISIEDNGKGIPEKNLNYICHEGASFNKENGSGLGLHHAMSLFSKHKGDLQIKSKEGIGTKVEIILPKATPHKTFVSSLKIRDNGHIVVIDDDQSIHGIWENRFNSLKLKNLKISHFVDPMDFKNWHSDQKENEADLYLIDFEYLNKTYDGIKLIKDTGIKDQNVNLVTSRFDEKHIINKCEDLSIGLLPKDLAGFIPINIEQISPETTTACHILLDDDKLIRSLWKMSAKKNNIPLKVYSSPKSLKEDLYQFNKKSTFYIDSNLSNNERGEDFAKYLFNLGYKNLYIETGHDPKSFSHLDFILQVMGKEPPWEA